MKSIKGNYIWWSAANLAAGILIGILGWLFTNVESVYLLAIALIPFVIFKFWFTRGRKPDERESQLLNKVFAESGMILFMAAWILSEKHFPFGACAIFSVALISRGGFGLYYFIRE